MGLSVVVVLVLFVVMVKGQSYWKSGGIYPEDDNCTVGESIPCGSVIEKNGTVLRYERGNLTHGSPSIPSEDCQWKITAPRGTSVRFETTCFHHFHVGNLTEYAVCYDLKSPIGRSSSCGGGYIERVHFSQNVGDLSVYYKEGHTYELGFTIEFTFVGEPIPDPTTSSPDLDLESATISATNPYTDTHTESTTSDTSRLAANYIFLPLAMQGVFISIGLQ